MAIRRCLIRHADDNEVLLEVDLSVFTPELATEINNFWGGAESRLFAQDGDVVQTAIRLFGARAMLQLQREGGVDFEEGSPDSADFWTQHVLEQEHEGWPDLSHLGIRIVQAYVSAPDYFDVHMEALS